MRDPPATTRNFRILVLEDDENDAQLLAQELRTHGFGLERLTIATDRASFEEHLTEDLDLILADFALPDFDAFRAVSLRNERVPHIPFIVVSGRVTESQAIDLMRCGADDYLMKDRLKRLPAAIETALKLRQLEQRALDQRDALTGLIRGSAFLREVDRALESARPTAGKTSPPRDRHDRCAVVVLDIDRFQTINASLGYLAGDQVLREVARRLTTAVPGSNRIARMGSDEFAILLESTTSIEAALDFAERIQHRLAAPVHVDQEELFVSAAVGLAVSTGEHLSAQSLFREAETAMYQAKARGRAQHKLYQDEMRTMALSQLRNEGELRRALQNREFRLHFQPIQQMDTGAVVGFEALLRWQHPDRGLLAPDQIIPLAEENGLIYPIGTWVLEEAMKTFARWRRSSSAFDDIYVSINVSARQFRQTDLLEHVRRVLHANDLPASCLCVEITETALMQSNEKAVVETFQTLGKTGVRLFLDDFGTGYSSLSYLSRFRVDGIKIDRSFVSSGERFNRAIVLMVLGLAERLDLPVIAEGIETEQQRESLLGMGCNLGQGYLFARAMKAEEVPFWISRQAASSSASPTPDEV